MKTTKNSRVFFVFLAASWRWSRYSLPRSRGEENLMNNKKMSSNVVVTWIIIEIF
jgi:hypothetical protein